MNNHNCIICNKSIVQSLKETGKGHFRTKKGLWMCEKHYDYYFGMSKKEIKKVKKHK